MPRYDVTHRILALEEGDPGKARLLNILQGVEAQLNHSEQLRCRLDAIESRLAGGGRG
jgi:hypothetical protein